MRLIFLNSLEKRTEEERVVTAQVSIVEEKGMWRVLWDEPDGTGKWEQHCWHEGQNWQDMLQAYREGIRIKRSKGFYPIVPAAEEWTMSDRNRRVLLLQYYGERHHNPDVFGKLREWRKEAAAKEGKSAFLIATNRMLHMLAAFLPRTEEELRMIPGFGKRRADMYKEAVLAITGSAPRQTGFPLDWVEETVHPGEFENWLVRQQLDRERLEQNRLDFERKLLELIAEGRNLTQLERQLNRRRTELVQQIEELHREGYDVSPVVNAELKSVPEEEIRKAEELFWQLGDRYLKPVLQQLYTEEQLQGKDLGLLYDRLRFLRIRFQQEHHPAASHAV